MQKSVEQWSVISKFTCTPSDHPIKCSGDHPAYSRTCSKWIFEEVHSVKCKRQVPFPEARKIVQDKSSTEKKSYARAATVDKPQFSSIQTQTDITWPINATDFSLRPSPGKNITPTPSHATMSTQTVNELSQQPTNIIEPTTTKATIAPKPSQNTKSYTRKPITTPQGGSQEPRRNSLGSRPSKGSYDNISQIRRERSFEAMYQSPTNQSREYTSYNQNDTFIDFNPHISFFSPFSHHG